MAVDNVDDDEEVQDRCQDDEEVKEDAKVKNTKVNKLKPNQKKSYNAYRDMGFDPELALTAASMDLEAVWKSRSANILVIQIVFDYFSLIIFLRARL